MRAAVAGGGAGALGVNVGTHSGDAQGLLDLLHMLEAYPLKGEAGPCVVCGREVTVGPKVGVADVVGTHKLEIEECKVINEQKNCLVFEPG